VGHWWQHVARVTEASHHWPTSGSTVAITRSSPINNPTLCAISGHKILDSTVPASQACVNINCSSICKPIIALDVRSLMLIWHRSL